jgi:hypothetical protein
LLTRDKRGVWAYYRLVFGARDTLGSALARPLPAIRRPSPAAETGMPGPV